MKPEIKKRWLKALRSGNYKKGTERLCDESNRFCCLGVLTDLYCEETGQEWGLCTSGVKRFGHTHAASYLPPAVREWAGITDWNPTLMHKGKKSNLATLNDHTYNQFGPIADLIEEQL